MKNQPTPLEGSDERAIIEGQISQLEERLPAIDHEPAEVKGQIDQLRARVDRLETEKRTKTEELAAAKRELKITNAESIVSTEHLLAFCKRIPNTSSHAAETQGSSQKRTDDGGAIISFQMDTGLEGEKPWIMIYSFPTHNHLRCQLAHGNDPQGKFQELTAYVDSQLQTAARDESTDEKFANWNNVDFSQFPE